MILSPLDCSITDLMEQQHNFNALKLSKNTKTFTVLVRILITTKEDVLCT